MKPVYRNLLIISAIVFALGIIASAVGIGMGAVRRDVGVEKTYTADTSAGKMTEISVTGNNVPLYITRTEGDEITVTYREKDTIHYTVTEQNNRLLIDQEYSKNWYDYVLNFSLSERVVVSVPDEYNGDLNIRAGQGSVVVTELGDLDDIMIEISGGSIELENVKPNSLYCATISHAIWLKNVTVKGNGTLNAYTAAQPVSSGLIKMDHATFGGQLTAKTSDNPIEFDTVRAANMDLRTSNSKLNLTNVISSGKLWGETTNGKIEAKQIKGERISLKTTNGKITGTVLGKMRDYRITSKTTNGKNNLPAATGGDDRSLDVETTNGKIEIFFTED